MDTQIFSHGIKRQGRDADHSSASGAEVRIETGLPYYGRTAPRNVKWR